jgi:hypothetical protein
VFRAVATYCRGLSYPTSTFIFHYAGPGVFAPGKQGKLAPLPVTINIDETNRAQPLQLRFQVEQFV